jgi:hypothetical protein
VIAAALLAVGFVALPAAAQTVGDTTPTTTTSESSTTTSDPTITLLPTTSSTLELTTTTSTRRTTTTVRRRTTTTTVPAGPAITFPATTTSEVLTEPAGPAGLPTTTSLPPRTGKINRGRSVGTLVLLVITALVLIALVLSVFTYRFWRSTGGGTVPDHG